LLLVVLLLGFIAMHGLASTSGDGTHGSPLALAAGSDAHNTMFTAASADDTTGDDLFEHGATESSRTAETGPLDMAPAETGEQGGDAEGSHAAMVGCLIALCGVAIVGLKLSGRGTLVDLIRELAALYDRLCTIHPSRPPSRRTPRISLCVLRV